jgi:hypothetical protein
MLRQASWRAGDETVGWQALVVTSTAFHDPQTHARRVWLWNLFAISDLIVRRDGIPHGASTFQTFVFDPPNELVTVFPLALIRAVERVT